MALDKAQRWTWAHSTSSKGAKMPDYVVCGKAVLPVGASLAHDLSDPGQAKVAITTSLGKVSEFSIGIDGISAVTAALVP